MGLKIITVIKIIILNNQKNAIIEKTTKQINDLKENLLSLIDKIKELKENQKLIDETKKEILIKSRHNFDHP